MEIVSDRSIWDQGMFEDEDGNTIDVETWERMRRAWRIKSYVGDVEISTVWIGVAGQRFETMVFGHGDGVDEIQVRYETKKQANIGHQRVLYGLMGVHVLRDNEWREYKS